MEALEFIDVSVNPVGEEGGAKLAGIEGGESDCIARVLWSEENEIMRTAADERVDAETDMAGGKVAFESGQFIGLVGPGDGDVSEAAILEPEGMLFGRRKADDVDGDRNVDAKGDVFGAEDVAFSGGEVVLDLFVGEIMELDGREILAEAFDDAVDGIVDGRMVANMSARVDMREKKNDREKEEGKIPAERIRH
jgi:hypothetical protein